MTALPLRPALADVLAVLTDTLPLQWSPESYRVTAVTSRWVGRRHPPRGMGVDGGVPLTITDPEEAFETLVAHGTLPDVFVGDERRAFAILRSHDPLRDDPCPLPVAIRDLVAWASLGPAAILRAEELARETVRRLRPWDAPQPERVVWRVGGRDEHKLVWSSDGGGHEVCSCGRGDPVSSPAAEIYVAGLAIDSITADAITIVVPPIGGEA